MENCIQSIKKLFTNSDIFQQQLSSVRVWYPKLWKWEYFCFLWKKLSFFAFCFPRKSKTNKLATISTGQLFLSLKNYYWNFLILDHFNIWLYPYYPIHLINLRVISRTSRHLNTSTISKNILILLFFMQVRSLYNSWYFIGPLAVL